MGRWDATTAHKFVQLPNGVLGTYNSHDAHNTARLGLYLHRRQGELGVRDFYARELSPLLPAVLAMQGRGLLVDKARLAAHRTRVRAELAECDTVILGADTTGALAEPTPTYPNSINSPHRLGRFLYGVLGLRCAKRTDSGLDSTDQEALYRVLRDLRKKDEPHRPVLESLFHRTRLATIQKRYLKLPIDPDGCVRPRVKITGTKTLRFAYAEPAMQQFPPEVRDVFVARPGRVFISRDYSQLEARLMAYLAGDRASVEVFEAGGDVHTANANDLFNTPGQARTKDDPARGFAKSFLYGIGYGGQAETMKTKLFCPCPRCAELMPPTLALKRDDVRAAQDRWFARHPEVPRWQRANADQVRRQSFYQHPFGYRRHFAQAWGSELDRELKNLPMQLGGAILMNRAQVYMHDAQAPIVLQMHDEFVLEVPIEELPAWLALSQGAMEMPIKELGGVVIPTEVSVGFNWGARSKANPTGMGKGLPQ